MHENLSPVVAGEEAEPLLGVIPLHLAGRHEQYLTSIRKQAPGRWRCSAQSMIICVAATGFYGRPLGYRYHAVDSSRLISGADGTRAVSARRTPAGHRATSQPPCVASQGA